MKIFTINIIIYQLQDLQGNSLYGATRVYGILDLNTGTINHKPINSNLSHCYNCSSFASTFHHQTY